MEKMETVVGTTWRDVKPRFSN